MSDNKEVMVKSLVKAIAEYLCDEQEDLFVESLLDYIVSVSGLPKPEVAAYYNKRQDYNEAIRLGRLEAQLLTDADTQASRLAKMQPTSDLIENNPRLVEALKRRDK